MVDENGEGKEDFPHQYPLMFFTGSQTMNFLLRMRQVDQKQSRQVDNFGSWKVENQQDKQKTLGREEIEWNLIPSEPKTNKSNSKNYSDEEGELELIEKYFKRVNKKRKHVTSSASSSTSLTFSTCLTTVYISTSSSTASTVTDTPNAKVK
ncbi:14166_t:CDS:2 [Entrophospora sp. SA101]|nr:14166_t:CDS:2 [Entrophospora sp. SA101]